MKIKVKREWREWAFLVDKESVCDYIKNMKQKTIHNFIANDSWILLWADWNKKSVIENIQSANVVAITIPQQMWHSLVTVTGQKRMLFDIWNITEDEWDIA